MAYIRLPGGIRVAMEYEAFGKVVVNIYHVTHEDPITTVVLLNIADIFHDWWTAYMSTSFSEDIALHNVVALNLDEANGEKVTFVVSPPEPGDVLLPAVSNNVAIVASLRTAKTGRSFRGRNYWAGLNDSAVTGNEITVAKAANLVSDYAELDTALAIEGAVLVVASFQSLGVPREIGVATPVQSVVVNTRVDTQRRRLPVS